jgi:uncharacterized protein HemX
LDKFDALKKLRVVSDPAPEIAPVAQLETAKTKKSLPKFINKLSFIGFFVVLGLMWGGYSVFQYFEAQKSELESIRDDIEEAKQAAELAQQESESARDEADHLKDQAEEAQQEAESHSSKAEQAKEEAEAARK